MQTYFSCCYSNCKYGFRKKNSSMVGWRISNGDGDQGDSIAKPSQLQFFCQMYLLLIWFYAQYGYVIWGNVWSPNLNSMVAGVEQTHDIWGKMMVLLSRCVFWTKNVRKQLFDTAGEMKQCKMAGLAPENFWEQQGCYGTTKRQEIVLKSQVRMRANFTGQARLHCAKAAQSSDATAFWCQPLVYGKI